MSTRLYKWLRSLLGTNGDSVSESLVPHERWPEILHWQPGDRFEWSMSGWYELVALSDDGRAYVSKVTDGHKQVVSIASLIGRNESLRDRRINQLVKNTAEYMELIRQFNIAYKELEARDRRNGVN